MQPSRTGASTATGHPPPSCSRRSTRTLWDSCSRCTSTRYSCRVSSGTSTASTSGAWSWAKTSRAPSRRNLPAARPYPGWMPPPTPCCSACTTGATDVICMETQIKPLNSYRKHWAQRFGIAPFLPMSREEMRSLGWDSCDIIIVTGDAYIDHPSFGMALVGRLLEAQGFRVGIISQPDWHSADAFRALGKPTLYYGITAGNMDSMVNRYTADRKIRSDDAYTANAEPNKRPDRALVVYAQRAREAFPDANVVIGSIEASLRRIAHYDYWSDKVRRSVLPDSKADMLLFGNAERALVDLTHRLAAGENIKDIKDLRGTAFMVPAGWLPADDWSVANSTRVDVPGKVDVHP